MATVVQGTAPDCLAFAVTWKSSYLLPRMLALAVLSTLPLLLLHTYTLYAEYQRAEAATYRAVLLHVDLAARTVDDVLGQAQAQLRLVARRRQAHQHDPRRCTSLLQALVQESRLLVRLDVHTAAGTLVCSSAAADTDPPERDGSWVADVMSRHGVWLSGPLVVRLESSAHRVHVMRLALATDSVPMQEGPAEVLSALVDLQRLSDSLSPAALPGGSVLSLYDAKGRILTRSPDFAQWVGKTMQPLGRNDSSLVTSTATAVGVDGIERLYASSRLQKAELQVSAGVPTATMTQPLADAARRSVLVALLVLLAGLGLAAYWSRIVGRSLRQLARAAEELASGRQAVQIDDRLPGELGALASQFNLMQEALQARGVALQASQHRAVRLSQLNEALSEAAHAAARLHDRQQLYERICRVCVDTGQASVAWLSMDGARVAMAADGSATDGAQLPPLLVDGECDAGLGARWQACCASGEVVVEHDLAQAACCDDVGPTLLAQGVRSAVALPVFVRGRHAGNLNLYANEPEFFDPDAIRLLKAVCADLAFALEAQETEKARQDAVQALARHEQQLAGIIDTAMDAIITIDASHHIVVFNRAAAEMFGVEPEEVIGGTLERFVLDSVPVTQHQFVEGLAQGTAPRPHHGAALRLTGLRATGEEFPLDATLVKLGSGADLLITATLRDVSRLEEAQAAKEAEARAEAASRAKSEFISHMNHELRTPLNAVLGFSQLLQTTARPQLTSKELKQLDMIFLAGAQLRSLIDEALDLSRIEAGRVELRMDDVELCALVHEIMLLLEPLAQEKAVRLHVPSEACGPLHARTDHKRLRQILINVLSNAIKYNRPGGTVSVTLREMGDEVELEVADTGLGMSPEQLERLFEPFNRLGREASGIEGSGIGMALTRRLVELLGGSLSVGSQQDVGTCVRLRLPCMKRGSEEVQVAPVAAWPPDAPAQRLALATEPRGRILYVEDNPVNVILVEAMLERWRALELVSAADVETGVRLAMALQPDLVLLDMHLGTATGHEFLARVRSDARTAALRVVALSASAMPHEIEAALQAGAMDYWTKPLDAAKFQAGISNLLGAGVDP